MLRQLVLISFLLLSAHSVSADLLNPVGYRSVNHNFETVSKALTSELEESYEFFILINTAEGPTKPGAFIPNQHIAVLKKAPNQKVLFKRDAHGMIVDIEVQTLRLQDILAPGEYVEAKTSADHGYPFQWNNLQVLPTSTGTLYNMATFSGVFQLNWDRSLRRYNSDFESPMSNSLYINYSYHDESVPRDQWHDFNRDQEESWAAIHGTPYANVPNLGRARVSHGCARMHPLFMEKLFRVVDNLPLKSVIQLDRDFELPTYTGKRVRAKPVLILMFNGYEGSSI